MSVYEKADKNMKKGKAARFNDNEFVQYELEDTEKKACKAWLTEYAEFERAVDDLAREDYKFSLKWDDYSSSQSAFIMQTDPKHANAGLVLTGRGSTPLRALKQAMYKHFVVFEGVWPRGTDRGVSSEFDD